MNIFKDLNEGGKTVIMVTHNSGFNKYPGRIIKLTDGKLMMEVINEC